MAKPVEPIVPNHMKTATSEMDSPVLMVFSN